MLNILQKIIWEIIAKVKELPSIKGIFKKWLMVWVYVRTISEVECKEQGSTQSSPSVHATNTLMIVEGEL